MQRLKGEQLWCPCRYSFFRRDFSDEETYCNPFRLNFTYIHNESDIYAGVLTIERMGTENT